MHTYLQRYNLVHAMLCKQLKIIKSKIHKLCIICNHFGQFKRKYDWQADNSMEWVKDYQVPGDKYPA